MALPVNITTDNKYGSYMTWKDRLQDASFRGVSFKVEEESAGIGRRVE
ncbi:DNA circularization N-terminal domain-containing protein, partial [Escherichia albertii]